MRDDRYDLGAIAGGGTNAAVRLERHLAATPLEVWCLLTEPAAMTDWLQATAEIEPRPGGALTLRFANTDTTIRGRVLHFDAPSVLEYTWRADGEPESVVRFELHAAPQATGTRLLLTHTRCDSGKVASFATGWHHHLELLATQLDEQPVAWDWARFEELGARYGLAVAGGNLT